LSDGVYLDGNKIEGIKEINIDSSVSKVSEVTLKIVCQVEGVDNIYKTTEPTDAYKITTGTLPADAITSDGQLDWDIMKERMLERIELIKATRTQKREAENNPTFVSNKQVGVNDSETTPRLDELKSTDDPKESEIVIPLMIDGNKFSELMTKTLNEYLKQIGNMKLNL